MSQSESSQSRRSPILGWIVFAAAGIAVFVLGMLASSINERRNESAQARVQFMQPIAKWEGDNSKWGASFPREYNSWESTKQMNERTRYGGSAHRDHLEEHPNLVILWAGFGFAKSYYAPRGHYWAVEDLNKSLRITDKTPATCYTCKSPDVPRLMEKDGVAAFYKTKFADYASAVTNPIGCADCHNNETMALQISRPALREAFKNMGKDISKVSHQEMRSLVCAQCHVEYYFDGKRDGYLTFPWTEGLTIEAMEKYYAKSGHVDWTHAISGAKMIKMQHPDYEVFTQGIHHFRGVSCADCHMPYKSEGGIKFTDHQIRSPLENIANSCQVCHRWSESEIKNRVYSMQDKHIEMMKRAEKATTTLHLEIGDAMKRGASEADLEKPRILVNQAQMYWDYVSANNGMGFHAPQECARILDKSLNFAYEGRLLINRVRAKLGAIDPIQMPDLSTKEKAQAFIKPYVDAQKARAAAAPTKPASPPDAKANAKPKYGS